MEPSASDRRQLTGWQQNEPVLPVSGAEAREFVIAACYERRPRLLPIPPRILPARSRPAKVTLLEPEAL